MPRSIAIESLGRLIVCALLTSSCSGGPAGLQNQPPSLFLDFGIESQTETEAIVRLTGNATDSDGTVEGIVCEGDFSGTFTSTFSETRTVQRLGGMLRTLITTCVATDDDGATANYVASATILAAPLSFSGTGATVTELFSIEAGFVTFKSSYNGSSKFAVRLRNAQGVMAKLIVNEIGSYDGTRGFGIPAGQYLLDIDADGPWEVTIRDARVFGDHRLGFPPPLTVMGTGDDVVPLTFSFGPVRFVMDHTGSSHFMVHLWPELGYPAYTPPALLANERGTAHVETAEIIETSGGYLDVHADGQWTITVEYVWP